MQRLPCAHNEVERSWIYVYTSIDIERAQERSYKILEFMEIWHYHNRGSKIFKDVILNIVRKKLECSGFPLSCESEESKRDYVGSLKEKSGIDIRMGDIRKDPAGRYLNKIMANLILGKWAQNPASQSSITTCGTIREYHEKLLTGRVKRTALISEKLMQVEMRQIN